MRKMTSATDPEHFLPLIDFVLTSRSSHNHVENYAFAVSPYAIIFQENQSPVIADQPAHDIRLSDIRERILADWPSSLDHQTNLEIEFDNIKRNCSNIFDSVKNISFEQDGATSAFNIFKDCIGKQIVQISEVTKMAILLSILKTSFVSTQADVILTQSNFESSASAQESIRSLDSKVDAC